MKLITGKFIRARVTRISGIGMGLPQYDNNVISANFKITDGPATIVDRQIEVTIPIVDLCNSLPVDTAIALYKQLVEMKIDRMAKVV